MADTKPLNPTHCIDEALLSADGAKARTWFVIVPASRSYASLFLPATWARCPKISTHDIVRCRAVDGSYDVMLVAAMRASGGVKMEFFAGRPGRLDATL